MFVTIIRYNDWFQLFGMCTLGMSAVC